MTAGACLRLIAAALCSSAAVIPASAQEAVTVTGHVQVGGLPLRGATVRVPALNISAITDAEGAYSFIVHSSRVRGQTVAITARHLRSRTVTDSITLVGASIVKDFDLASASSEMVASPTSPGPKGDPGSVSRVVSGAPASGSAADSTVFGSLVGPTDFSSSLAGRLAGLRVTTASSIGGSAPFFYRGLRSVNAAAAPLVVVDGIVLNGSTFGDQSQRLGFGGFDYGSPIDDLNPWDIRSVEIVSPERATSAYGGRAANGVIVVTTRTGAGLNGIHMSFSQGISDGSPRRMPTLQNAYGQGSKGAFAFFDGKGAGLNDAIAESWGPALDGRPVVQASLTEVARPDVRYWLPNPTSLLSNFATGRTYSTDASVAGGGSSGSFRLSLRNRETNGIRPGSILARRGATFTGERHLSSAMDLDGHLEFVHSSASGRIATGFEDANPVASLITTPRQVDVNALRTHLRDATGAQINWIYTNRNNPNLSALESANDDSRDHIIGGGSVAYTLSSRLVVAARLGIDSYSEGRRFSIAPDWRGGFSSARGRLSFASGGYQHQDVSGGTAFAQVSSTTSGYRLGIVNLSLNIGADLRRDRGLTSTIVYDTAAVGNDTAARALFRLPVEYSFTSRTTSEFVGAIARIGESGSLAAGVRREQSNVFPAGHEAHLFPFVNADLDVGGWAPGLVRAVGLTTASLRGGWSRSAVDLSPYQIRAGYGGAKSPDGVAVDTGSAGLGGPLLDPEITSGIELGAVVGGLGQRVSLGITLYKETTDGLVLTAPGATTTQFTAQNAGVVSNVGVEGQLTIVPIRRGAFQWDADVTFARNRNRVERFFGPEGQSGLSPGRWGVSVEARPGQPLGVLVGSTFLRSSETHEPVLKNGLPIADNTTAGIRVLGVAQPTWVGGLSNTLRLGRVEMSLSFDGQFGGHVFSATNRFGAVSGNLSETGFRPDSGLLIVGVDSATGTTNTRHVSSEDYYHALAAIAERWVYSANFVKLRNARISTSVELPGFWAFRAPTLRVAVIGRNLALWAKAPNIDPETAVSGASIQGFELGQLPMTRSVGLQFSITP